MRSADRRGRRWLLRALPGCSVRRLTRWSGVFELSSAPPRLAMASLKRATLHKGLLKWAVPIEVLLLTPGRAIDDPACLLDFGGRSCVRNLLQRGVKGKLSELTARWRAMSAPVSRMFRECGVRIALASSGLE